MDKQSTHQKKPAPTRSHPTKTSVKSPLHPVEELQGAIGNRQMGLLIQEHSQSHPSSVFPTNRGAMPMLGGMMPIGPGRIQRQPEFRGLSQELAAENATLALPATGALVQRKLTLGAPGDMYEEEADRVARQVVDEIHSTPFREQNAQSEEERNPAGGNAGRVQRQITVRSAGDAGGELSSEWEGQLQGAKSGGQPLSPSVKEPMERAFGADFGGVRVHTGAQADRLARSIQAKAFTTGPDVFFRQGAYEPGSRGGQKLIAHELTHVEQQVASATIEPPVHQIRSVQKLPPEGRKKANTIQRFYAVKDEQNAEEHPQAETGGVNEASNMEWIYLPDPREENIYPYTVEGTGWIITNLYAKVPNLRATQEQNAGNEQVRYLMQPLRNYYNSQRFNPYNSSLTGGVPSYKNVLKNSLLLPVPKVIADNLATKAQSKIKNYTPHKPIEEGMKDAFTSRLEVIAGKITSLQNPLETIQWLDYLTSKEADKELDTIFTAAKQKMSEEKQKEFSEDIEKLKISEMKKLGSSLGTGITVGQILAAIPHPIPKGLSLMWKGTGLVALNNKLGECNDKMRKMENNYPEIYTMMKNKRDESLEKLNNSRYPTMKEYKDLNSPFE